MNRLAIVLTAALAFIDFAALAADPQPPRVLDFDPDWTPRPAEGDAPPWEKETDVDWVDDRLRSMDTGRTFNATFRYSHAGQDLRTFKGTSIRIGDHGQAAMLFDRNQLRWSCGWTCAPLAEPVPDNPTGFTSYLQHSDRRFGLLNTPAPQGEVIFSTPLGAGADAVDGTWNTTAAPTGPLPRERGRFLGLVRFDNRAAVSYRLTTESIDDTPCDLVTEFPWTHTHDGITLLTRAIDVALLTADRSLLILSTAGAQVDRHDTNDLAIASVTTTDGTTWVALRQFNDRLPYAELTNEDDRLAVRFTGTGAEAVVCLARGDDITPERFANVARVVSELERPTTLRERLAEMQLSPLQPPAQHAELRSQREWPQEIATPGERSADDAAYVVDTLTVPHDNPFRALMFVSGVDFIPRAYLAGWWPSHASDDPDRPPQIDESDNVAVVTTAHGDVWIVDGIDDDLKQLTWRRYATGLYQPLGVKFVNGELYVLERGQLTRLRDMDGNGEADVYHSFNADWHVGGGEHSYDTCLEQDLAGNFYFHSTGDPHTPTGGAVIRVSADGTESEVFCTGFRHPIGMGVLPDGRITGADQEGNWMPATRIDIYHQDGFYGDMRAHHRDTPPEIYDQPLCWLPRQMDNSAGGQIWVDRDDFGPLSRRFLHLSYGKCGMMLLMPQKIGDIEQAGAVDLGLQFLSGIQRGRFRNSDGHFYVTGMDGWQTAAQADGCLQRVRYTGQPITLPVDLTVKPHALEIEFNEPVDAGLAKEIRRYHIEQWNYHWSGEYGSKRWSIAKPDVMGQDEVPIKSVKLSADARRVTLETAELHPVMQMQIEYRIADAEGQPLRGTIYNTIHTTGE